MTAHREPGEGKAPDKSAVPAVTAGLRGASWQAARMSRPYQAQLAPLLTQDGQSANGVLYSRGAAQCAVFIMHPREFLLTHYLTPDVLDAGWACWIQGSRSAGADLLLEHEIILYDVAAGLRHLRAQGINTIVLLGNSGGAGLMALYNQQSLLPAQQRIERTPGGRPTRLANADLPVADGLAFISPHPGQGILLMNAMDASVSDEADPLATEPTLDPFSAANGFVAPPHSSTYPAEFVRRYRAAQRARVARLDAYAHALLQTKQQARTRLASAHAPAPAAAPVTTTSSLDERLASFGPIFTVWRTDADLRCWDSQLDPSDRAVGSLWGANPLNSNWGSVGFGRVVTPQSWLSTWSGLSSNAAVARCAPAIEQPTLFITYSGDSCVFPTDSDALYASIGSRNKERHQVRGNHHGQALLPGEPLGQTLAGAHLKRWLKETFS